jgi:RNA polymerase sigma factor (sigma-70 family)
MTAAAQIDDLELAYRRFKQPLLKKARLWFPTLRGSEADLYQNAWESLLRNVEDVDDVEKYLEMALYNRGVDELRARELRPADSLETIRVRYEGTQIESEPRGEDRHGGPDSLVERTAPLPDEQVETQEEALLVLELLAELTPLQQRILAVRWAWGIRRKQAAPMLGISERRAKRALEKAVRKLTRNVELVRDGRWCEEKRSLILAYSFDLLSPRRAAKAERHLAACVSCRYVAREVQIRLERAAALVPLPVLALQPPESSPFARIAELLESALRALADLASALKHHALQIFARTPAGDAVAAHAAGGGLRGGGGLVAAVAACVIAGGGATYCAVEGVPIAVRDIAGIEAPHAHKKRQPRKQPAKERVFTQKPTTAAPKPVGDATGGQSQSAGNADPKPSKKVVPASPAPPGSTEFGVEAQSSAVRTPAPAPADGGGEFTP